MLLAPILWNALRRLADDLQTAHRGTLQRLVVLERSRVTPALAPIK